MGAELALKAGTFWIFLNVHSVAKYHENWRGPSGDIEKFLEKSLSVPKKLKGRPFSLVRFVSYAEKEQLL